MGGSFVPAVEPPPDPHVPEPAWWFAWRGADLLVRAGGDRDEAPCLGDLGELGLAPIRRQYLGSLAGRGCWSAELPGETDPPPGMAFHGLRALHGRLDDAAFAVAGRAAQIVEWDRTHQFCGRCATPTAYVAGERAKRCPRCGLTGYPRLSPAVIVLVERDDRVLLARAEGFPSGLYSVLAGFVEPGESLEEAVYREVQEEVGISLIDLRYVASQPWPFPHSLMVGFTARYAGGTIRCQPGEIADAGWYPAAALPLVPAKPSIARQLIDAFVARRRSPTPR